MDLPESPPTSEAPAPVRAGGVSINGLPAGFAGSVQLDVPLLGTPADDADGGSDSGKRAGSRRRWQCATLACVLINPLLFVGAVISCQMSHGVLLQIEHLQIDCRGGGRPPAPQVVKFDCDTSAGHCAESMAGKYTSNATCAAAGCGNLPPSPPPKPPPKKFSCDSGAGQCAQSVKGNYSSNATCSASCKKPGPACNPQCQKKALLQFKVRAPTQQLLLSSIKLKCCSTK